MAPGKPPQPHGLGGGRAPGVSESRQRGGFPAALRLPRPPLPAGCSGNPAVEVPDPTRGASFRGCFQVPSTSPAARCPSPHGAACVFTACGSLPLVSLHGEAGRTCLGAFGSPWGYAHLVECKGWWRAGSALRLGWAGGYLQLLRACVLAFVPRCPRWMRCCADRGVQAWAVQIKSS